MTIGRWTPAEISGWFMADFLIRPYSPADSIPAITALLHEAYGSLARQGFRFLASHQDDDVIANLLNIVQDMCGKKD